MIIQYDKYQLEINGSKIKTNGKLYEISYGIKSDYGEYTVGGYAFYEHHTFNKGIPISFSNEVPLEKIIKSVIEYAYNKECQQEVQVQLDLVKQEIEKCSCPMTNKVDWLKNKLAIVDTLEKELQRLKQLKENK